MFSKEGLALAQKQDPKEKARNEMRDWINTTVATLTEQVEHYTFDWASQKNWKWSSYSIYAKLCTCMRDALSSNISLQNVFSNILNIWLKLEKVAHSLL